VVGNGSISSELEVKLGCATSAQAGAAVRDEGWLSIGRVAERSGLAVSAIRYYEEQGLIAAERTDGGQRRFRREVLRRLAVIQAAQRVGLTLEEIGTALSCLPTDAAPTEQEWASLSSAWRPLLDARIQVLQGLRDQLDRCIGCGCLSLEACGLRNPDDAAAADGAGPRYLLAGQLPGERDRTVGA
jgi:MerR family transcriptional regulator, redox-sensitive transcriptional activator SoxR